VCAGGTCRASSRHRANRSKRLRRLLLIILLLAGSCVAPSPRSAPEAVAVKLVAFNDFHGHLEPPRTPTRLPAIESQAESELSTGGVAWLAGQIDAFRGSAERVAVVAAGDLIGGSPLISSLLNHESTLSALGETGLEFSAVGNHEFDRGVAELLRLQALGNFQYLGANVRYREGGKTVFPAWRVKQWPREDGGTVKVAFIGAVLESTPALVHAAGIRDVEFIDEAQAVNAAVREVRAAGIEAIVLLIHEGGFIDSTRFDDLDCPGFRGPILDIVDRLDPAVDVVVSGHTHRTYVCRYGGRLVTSAGQEGRFLTEIDLTLDAATGDVRYAVARQWPVINDRRPNPLSAEYAVAIPDASLLARVAAWSQSIAPLARREIGRITVPLTRRQNAHGETLLGDVVADAQLAATAAPEEGGAQMAIVNNGGLRADLDAPDGSVSYEQVFGVHPFGNHLVTLTLTGAEIDTLLETQWQGAGSLLQVSAGLQFRWHASAPPGQRIAADDILLHGQPLSPQGQYRVTVSDFLAGGGDGYAVLRNGRDAVTGVLDAEALEKYVARPAPLAAPATGRILKLP